MSEIIRAIILGVIQGLTEFLPVSSSGHLELAKYFLNDTSVAEESMLMTVILHAATALSTMVIFRKDIIEIFQGLWEGVRTQNWSKNEDVAFSLKIILSMIPAAFVGLFFEDALESLFDQQILLVGLMLILTGLLLFLADRAKKTDKKVTYTNALIIGIAQAIAILPGISRSGATISAAVLLGVDRSRSARFSFLMVVPLILGKMAKDILGGEIIYSSEFLVPLLAGFAAAFCTGLVACTWMIQLVKRSNLSWFSYYCFVVAAIAIYFGMR